MACSPAIPRPPSGVSSRWPTSPIRGPTGSPDWTIRFHDATEGAYGYTLTRDHHIDIYVRADQDREL